MQKIIFMDIDGTLLTQKDGANYIPESAINAIQTARKNGHLVYLCSGRSKAEIGNIQDIGFDGIIGAAGGYIEHEGNVIFHNLFDTETADTLRAYLDKYQIGYILETNNGLYYTEDYYKETIDYYFDGVIPENNTYAAVMHILNPEEHFPVNKIAFHSVTRTFAEMEQDLKEHFSIVPSSFTDLANDGEISLLGTNKATAIRHLLNYLQLDAYQTFGFGDSMNDIEMFEEVDIAVAMGNSKEQVKEKADFITKDLLDDGVAYAMQKLELV